MNEAVWAAMPNETDALAAIAPSDATTEGDLVEHLRSQLDERQLALQHAVGRCESMRHLLGEALRAQALLPTGVVLTIAAFLPHGLDDLTTATRRHLIEAALGEGSTT